MNCPSSALSQKRHHRPRARQLQPPQNLPHHRRRRRQRVDKERGRLQQAAGQRCSSSTGGLQRRVQSSMPRLGVNRLHFTLLVIAELSISLIQHLEHANVEITTKSNGRTVYCCTTSQVWTHCMNLPCMSTVTGMKEDMTWNFEGNILKC